MFAGNLRSQDVLDGIAAVVNGDVITFSQVRELVGARERALRESFKGKELTDKVREVRLAALQDLIDRQLVLQDFKKNKFSIPPFIVEDRVQQIIREEFGGDRQAFMRTLEAQGYTLAKFKDIERERIIVKLMRQRNVKSEVVIPPGKVEEYYHQNSSTWASPEQIKLRMIMLKKEGSDSSGKKKMAEEILHKIKEGAQFEQLAQMYSEDSSQETGGDWGWIDHKTLSEELTNAAFKLKAGETSPVIEVGGNYYILYCEARKNATVKPLAEVRDEIEKKLVQTEQQKQQQKWIDGLRAKAYIKTF